MVEGRKRAMEKDAMLSDCKGGAAQPIGPPERCLIRSLPVLLLLAACATSAPSSVPHAVWDFYENTYRSAADHKAFALATGPFTSRTGFSSAYSYGYSSDKEAIDGAILACNETRPKVDVNEPCRLYAVGDIVVWGKSDQEIEALISFDVQDLGLRQSESIGRTASEAAPADTVEGEHPFDGTWKGNAVIMNSSCRQGPSRFDLTLNVENGRIHGGDQDGVYSAEGEVSFDGRLKDASLNRYILMEGSLAEGIFRLATRDCGAGYALKKIETP